MTHTSERRTPNTEFQKGLLTIMINGIIIGELEKVKKYCGGCPYIDKRIRELQEERDQLTEKLRSKGD